MRFCPPGPALLVAVAVLAGSALCVPSPAEACPIETEMMRKVETYGSLLPDCRAYEQVSPVNKNTTDAAGRPGLVQSSPKGESVSYYSVVPFPISLTASEFPTYLGTRENGTWATQGLDAPVEPGAGSNVVGLTGDNGEVLDDVTTEFDERFLLAPGAEVEHPNVYVRDNATGEYKLLTTRPGELTYADSTPDGSHILFTSKRHELVSGVVDEEGEPFLYEWDRETDQISFIGYVGVNVPYYGTVAGSNEGEYSTNYDQNTISEDGSRIFFSEKNESRKVYMREPMMDNTVEVSAGEAQWRAATPSGLFALYTEAGELYRFNVAGDGNLSQAREKLAGSGAKVLGTVGMSTDGSYVYFVAEGVLAASQNGNEEKAEAGKANLYEWHEGAPVSFIARLVPATDQSDWVGFAEPSLGGPEKGYKGSRLSTNGTGVLFSSTARLIKYTNAADISYNNNGQGELYLYDAPTGQLRCVSCNLARGDAKYPTYLSENDAGSVPGSRINAVTRNLSAEGTRVFFQTEEELLPRANAQMNVYEWELEGTGSCGVEEGEEMGGCLYVISNGGSSTGAYFGDASENGEDVFFFTRQSLVGQDRDDNIDIYDARIDGGIASQSPEVSSSSCASEACRGLVPASEPTFGAQASLALSGIGNLPGEQEYSTTHTEGKHPTRAEKLARALKACRKKPRRRRAGCMTQARTKYGNRTKTVRKRGL